MRSLLLTLLVCTLALPANAQYSGGSGTADDPYRIATAADLVALGETPDDYDQHFVLTADIDLDPNLPGRKVFDRAVIAPDADDTDYGFDGTPFTGVFDGSGRTISHLTITGEGLLGLFGLAESPAEIRDLAVVDVHISGSAGCVGGLVGSNGFCHFDWSAEGGLVADCSAAGTIIGGASVGGLIGANFWGPVTRCSSAVTVEGQNHIGGLIGSNGYDYSGGTISDSYSSGTISGQDNVGGLVGSDSGGIVIRCYSTTLVRGAGEVGGLVGSGEGNVTGSFWDAETSEQAVSAGGTGLNTAEMQDMRTYQAAGWDFAGQIADGLHEIWWMPEGGGYPALAHFSGYQRPRLQGLGTAEQPYLISDANELGAMIYYSHRAHYRLTAWIDLSSVRWPVAVIPSFGGRFDGNGLKISHLTIVGAGELGLFSELESDAQVTNLAVVDVNIIGSDSAIGGLAGRNMGAVTGCCSTGVVSGTGSVGGLLGTNSYTGLVTNCYSSVATSGGWGVGGLIGAVDRGTVIRCYAAGPVGGAQEVGGLVGGGSSYSIRHAVWDVETSGLPASAGGVGLRTTEMMDPYMLGLNGFAGDPNWILDEGRDYPRLAWEGTPGEVIAGPTIDWLAGQGTEEAPYRIDTTDQLILVGQSSVLWDRHLTLGADIDLDPNLPGRKVFAQALIPAFTGIFDGGRHTIFNLTISGGSYLGLFGQIGSGGQVSDVGIVDARIVGSGMEIGALAGANYQGTVTRCYSTGSVSGDIDVGGLVGGVSMAQVSQCYSAAAVSGDLPVGGLVGGLYSVQDDVATITDCYSRGPVNGELFPGGLLGGSFSGVVSRCYSTGAVSGFFASGLVGEFPFGLATFASFYDIQTAGMGYSQGALGLTTAEMQTAATFLEAGWDFIDETENGTEDIWWIDEGQDYPRLWWELPEEGG